MQQLTKEEKEKINIKIAESLGLFDLMPLKRTTRKGKDDPNGVVLWYCSEHHGGAATYDKLPNYTDDLNHCFKFEKTLTTEEVDLYYAYLKDCELFDDTIAGDFVFHADSISKCLCYIKVKNL